MLQEPLKIFHTHDCTHEYRNWPRYGLCWSGWYCNPAQHELCRPRDNFYFTTLTILQKARETCVFDVLYRCSSPSAFALRRMTMGQLVTSQLVCDVTINRPRTTSATANLGFHSKSSLKPCNLQEMICRWMNDNTKMCTSDAMNLEEITHL